MTFDERVKVVAAKGFTEHQARFLVTVMLHTGVCVPRQYARFCRIVHGQKTRKFFDKLVRLRLASAHECRHNRARLYHVNQRALYADIGDVTSRLRLPQILNRSAELLMVLDAIVEDPELVWLGTAEDKTSHMLGLTRVRPEDLPHATIGNGERRTARYFVDRLPIGIDPAGRATLVYVLSDHTLMEFRVFLERHTALLRALPAWTVRVVLPPLFSDMSQRVHAAFITQLGSALSPERVDAVRKRFEGVKTQHYPYEWYDTHTYDPDRDPLAAPRYHALFRIWKQEGGTALEGQASPTVSTAVTSGAGAVETLDLSQRYRHLTPRLPFPERPGGAGTVSTSSTARARVSRTLDEDSRELPGPIGSIGKQPKNSKGVGTCQKHGPIEPRC